MEDFVTLLKSLLVEEKGYTIEDAERIVDAHPDIVSSGIMYGNSKLRATAMALEIHESQNPNNEIN